MDSKYENFNVHIYHFIERKNNIWQTDEVVSTMENLTYVVSGTLHCTIGGMTCLVNKGDVLYIPKSTAKRFDTLENVGLHCFTLLFKGSLPDYDYERLDIPTVMNVGFDNEILDIMNKLNLV